jgi:PAS domain S-box-containing protein
MAEKLKTPNSLNFQIISAFVAVGLLVQTLYVAISLKDQAQYLEDIFFEKAISLGEAFDAGLSTQEVSLEAGQSVFQEKINKFLWLNPEILTATLYLNSNGGLVTASSTNTTLLGSEPESIAKEAFATNQASVKDLDLRQDDSISAAVPIHSSGQTAGAFVVEVSAIEMKDNIRTQAITSIGLSSSVLILFAIIIFLIVSNTIVKPVAKLTAAAKVLSEGNLKQKVSESGPAEIKTLSQSFNLMAESVQQSQGELETRVKIQTQQLEEQQIALINLLEDLSEEKQVEESQSQTLLENMGDGIVVTNEEGVVTYVNPAFTRLLGYSGDEIIGTVISDQIPTFDIKGNETPPAERSDAAMVTAKHQETKMLFQAKNGEKVAIIINAKPIMVESEFKGVIRVLHNFTEELNIARQKDEFFSIASHELRTPLTVISGNLDLMLTGMNKSKIDPEDLELLKDSETAADRLIKMVNDFLNVSRLDQGRIKIEVSPSDICQLTQDMVEELTPLANKDSTKIEFSCNKDHGKVLADIDKTKEVLINLIGNSMKFTKNGTISVSHNIKGKYLETVVSDNGLGIAQDKQGLLFGRFQQAMDRTLAREAGGTGLGLYISREFIRLMGGDLVLVKSEPGKGTTFSFTLPLVKEKN